MKGKQIFRIGIISLLVGTALSLVMGMWSLQRQVRLSENVIRLHVVAASDSGEDQTLKLHVRDAVMARVATIMQDAADRSEAEDDLQLLLPEIQTTAENTLRAAGHTETVTATLTKETFPTRDYGTFALPAGSYLALRIVIGEGGGHNWWCVVFPPLCNQAVSSDPREEMKKAGVDDADAALIMQENEAYQLQFKSIELWEQWRASIEK